MSNSFAWLDDDSLGWNRSLPVNKIDVHHHVVTDFFVKALDDAGGDPGGWPQPLWTAEASLKLMDNLGTQTSILSVSAPGPNFIEGDAGHRLAHRLNELLAATRDSNPQRFGFFVSVGDIHDTQKALDEIAYGLDVLKGDGVTLLSRYGKGSAYLGDPKFEPIWAELHRRRTVVFIHPTNPADTTLVNPKLPSPVIDYPHETARTVMDLLTRGTRRKYPDCHIILSHAGGTLPYLFGRVMTGLTGPGQGESPLAKEFRTFHFDLALSTHPSVVTLLRSLVPDDQILIGSDFPHAPPPAFAKFSKLLEEQPLEKSTRDKIYFQNAQRLFPRLANKSEL